MRFFLTAPIFIMVAAITLFLYGPGAVASRWTPELLAVTHFLTLGFLAMIMIGALQQLTPVLMGVSIPRPEVFSVWIHTFLTIGVGALGGAWLWGESSLFVFAVPLLIAAISVFVLVLLFLVSRSGFKSITSRSAALAMLAFLVTLALGIYLALGYVLDGLVRLPRMTDQHLTWGLVGWVTLLMSGVAYQVIPMFQITADYPRAMTRWFSPLLFVLLLSWSAILIFELNGNWLFALGTMMAVGLVVFALVTLYLLQRRRRRMPDATLSFWRTAMLSLLLTVMAWGASDFIGQENLELLLGVLMVVGFAMSAISGMLYKIVPFLIWLHLNNRLQARGRFQGKIPNMKQVIPERKARLHYRVHLLMLVLVLSAVLWPHYLLRPAAAALLLTAVIMWLNLLSALRLYYRVLREAN
jgi:hypothetical protein